MSFYQVLTFPPPGERELWSHPDEYNYIKTPSFTQMHLRLGQSAPDGCKSSFTRKTWWKLFPGHFFFLPSSFGLRAGWFISPHTTTFMCHFYHFALTWTRYKRQGKITKCWLLFFCFVFLRGEFFKLKWTANVQFCTRVIFGAVSRIDVLNVQVVIMRMFHICKTLIGHEVEENMLNLGL